MTDYSKLSAEELRKLLLAGVLLHEHMTEEDYTALLDIEADFDEPSEEVIDFCFAGLSVLPKYTDIGKRDFSINELFKKTEIKNSAHKHGKIRKAALIIAAVISSMLVAQLASSAMGFNLFGYFFNWKKPEVVEITNSDAKNDIDSENIMIEYTAIEEIPIEMKNLVPNFLFDTFELYNAFFIVQGGNKSYSFGFFDSDDNFLSFEIKRVTEWHIEKDDNGYYEEYSYNDTVFEIFTNTGQYQAVWVKDEYVCAFFTHFEDLQEFRDILNNF